MMSKEKKGLNIFKRNWSLLLAMLLTFIVMSAVLAIYHIAPFGGYTLADADCIMQYIPFLSEYRHKLASGESILFSWNVALGSDFFVLFIYYLTSPLNLLLVFFKRSDLHSFISLVILIRTVLSAGTMGYFLSNRDGERKNGLVITALSVAYALSAFTLGYCWNIMWFDCIWVFPILMLGMNRLIRDNKPTMYILSLAYCIYTNYYIAYIICIFLVIWFFTYKFDSAKDFFAKGVRFALSSILSAGLTFLTLWATVMGIKYWPAANEPFVLDGWYSNFFSIIRNIYTFSKPITTSQIQSDANLYASVAAVVLLFFFPFVKKISLRDRVSRIAVIAFLLISMNFSTINYILHGFHTQMGIPNRFSFIYIFMIIECAYLVLENSEGLSTKRLIPGCVVSLLLPMVIFFFIEYNGYLAPTMMLVAALAISFVYCVTFMAGATSPKAYRVVKILFAVMILTEMIANAFVYYNNTDIKYVEDMTVDMSGRASSIKYVKDISAQEGIFYREEIESPILTNENVYQNIRGVGVFNSTVSGDVTNTMNSLGLVAGYPYYHYNGVTPILDDLLGVKYVHSFWENGFGYDGLCESENGDIVFVNDNAHYVGFGVPKSVQGFSGFAGVNGAENYNLLVNTLGESEAAFEQVNYDIELNTLVGTAKYENGQVSITDLPKNIEGQLVQLDGYFTVDKDGDYYLQLKSSHVYGVFVGVNGEEDEDYFEGHGQMIHVGYLNAGDIVVFRALLPGQDADKESFPIYISRYNEASEYELNQKLSRNMLNVTDFGANTLKGDFTIDGDQLLLLTIPYSKGWTVYVDGQKTECSNVLGGFIGIEAAAGTHTLQMKYVPEGFYTGIVVTIIFWIIFIAYIIILKRKMFIQLNKDTIYEDE